MTREEAKELWPIIKAFGEGKTIQFQKDTNVWEDMIDPMFSMSPSYYRIKPEPKYRPFKSMEECWQEMQKHQPFGWVIRSGVFLMVQSIYLDAIHTIEDNHGIDLEDAFTELTFSDGAPFGIKEE